MRKTLLHRRATAYLRRMPAPRRDQMLDALKQVAELDDISNHAGIRAMSGAYNGWYRLRVGTYRAVLKPEQRDGKEVLYVDYIAPRGDAY